MVLVLKLGEYRVSQQLWNRTKAMFYQSKYLFICFSSYTPSYKKCEIIGTPAKYGINHVSFGYQKHWPYQGIFDYYLREMKEKGALKRIFSKYEKGAQICPDLSGKALGFESCFTAFLFLLSGKLQDVILFFMIPDK